LNSAVASEVKSHVNHCIPVKRALVVNSFFSCERTVNCVTGELIYECVSLARVAYKHYFVLTNGDQRKVTETKVFDSNHFFASLPGS
jgi:hypothetical protein